MIFNITSHVSHQNMKFIHGPCFHPGLVEFHVSMTDMNISEAHLQYCNLLDSFNSHGRVTMLCSKEGFLGFI
jgi:hypothetical protein